MTTRSQTTGYAIEALACLARNGSQSMLVREVAALSRMPLPYLSKIFQRLGEAGIVESKRGYKGGVKLARPAAEISLLQIDAALEAGRNPARADGPGGAPQPNPFWEAFQRDYRERLAAISLAEVLAHESPSS